MICYFEAMPVKKDFTQIALDVVRKATGEVTAPAPSKKAESGRKGGLKGGRARMDALTDYQRTTLSLKGVAARKKAPAGEACHGCRRGRLSMDDGGHRGHG